jgi:hypothetical protein
MVTLGKAVDKQYVTDWVNVAPDSSAVENGAFNCNELEFGTAATNRISLLKETPAPGLNPCGDTDPNVVGFDTDATTRPCEITGDAPIAAWKSGP